MNNKVSLVIPAFIRDSTNLRYFAEALNSALAQTFEAIEILVVNDGSPLTAQIEGLPQLCDRRVRYFTKLNGGVSTALNLGLTQMQGEFFTWLSHDDLYLPNKVQEQVKAAAAYPDTSVFYCDVEHIDQDGNHLFFEQTPEIPPVRQYLYHAQYGCFNANSYLIHRRCFDVVGKFDENLRTTQDNHLWFRIARHFTSIRVPKVLMKYRHHPTQDSRSPIHLDECNDLFIYFLRNVTREDLASGTVESPAKYFAECACLRKDRGYTRAQWYAWRRAFGEWIKRPWADLSTINLLIGTAFSSKRVAVF